jgi:hypothetical protein
VVPFRVLSRTNLAGSFPSTSLTSISFASFRLRTLDLSSRSFSYSDPLFSITSGLFLQNTRSGGTSLLLSFKINNIQPLFPRPVTAVATGVLQGRVLLGLRNPPALATTRSGTSVTIDFVRPLFHILTNCFSRNSLPFKTIQIAPEVGPRRLRYFGCAPSNFRPSDIHTARPSDFWYSAGISGWPRHVQGAAVHGVSPGAAVNHMPCGGIAMCNFCGVSRVLAYGCAETRSDERAG